MSQTTAWLALFAAGVLDVAWAVSMKYAAGYTRLGWTLLSLLLLAGFVFLLGRCLTVLPVGTAYAVWTGIGAAGTAIYGMVFLGDVVSTLKIVSISLVIIGVIGLQLSGSAH